MTYRGDKTRERKNEKARACVGHDELGARRRYGETTGCGNGNVPIPRLEGLGKGEEIEAPSKVELLARSIGKWCSDDVAFADARASKGEEMRERADGRVMVVLKSSQSRLVGPMLVYGHQMASTARCQSATTGLI